MDIVKKYKTSNEQETINLGQKMADPLEIGDLVFLNGPLGAGKSVMARAIIRSLVGNNLEEVPSPTFTLMQQYETKDKGLVWHYDLYRLEQPEEIYETGWEDILYQDIILIEWPEKLEKLTPHKYIDITITPQSGDEREIIISKKGY